MMDGKDASFVRSLVSTFDRTERTILALHYCEDLTASEIGMVLDLSAHQVSRTLDAIRERTRAAVEARQTAGALA